MEKKGIKIASIDIKYQILDSPADLTEEDRQLLKVASEHLSTAYAPYSKFEVSAAILLDNGIMVAGSNQENAVYPLGICAEQNILSTAGSSYQSRRIMAMAITARAKSKIIKHPVSPCGACRQFISEFEDRQQYPIRIILRGETGQLFIFDSIKDLLPLSFSKGDLR